MIQLIKIMICLWLATTLFACKKTTSEAITLINEETITDVKKQEPITLNFNANNTSTKTAWTVTPNLGVTISQVNTNATFTFENAGSYNIEAIAGNLKSKYTVIVNNNLYINYGNSFNVIASKFFNIQKNEVTNFFVANTNSNNITWSIYPSNSASIFVDSLDKKNAKISFNNSGKYEVTAFTTTDTSTKTIWVDTALNNNLDTTSFLVGEKLLITPTIQSIGGRNVLVLKTITSKNYHCISDIILSNAFTDYGIFVNYAGVAISKQPCTSLGFASCESWLQNIKIGTHNFAISYQNQQFWGTLSLNGNGVYTFTWNNNSVIEFTKLTTN